MEKANELLGEPSAIHGRVVHGNHIGGSLLGFPTANIVPPSIKRLPRFGVYVLSLIHIFFSATENVVTATFPVSGLGPWKR